MKRLLLSAGSLLLVAPLLAAAESYLVMERGADPHAASMNLFPRPSPLPSPTPDWPDSPNGIEYPAVVVIPGTSQGAPSEPIGCKNTVAGQSCWNATDSAIPPNSIFPGNTNGVYGWPKLELKPDAAWPNDTYIVETNFWNNEAVLGDKTQYTAGNIYMPGMGKTPSGRYAYPNASYQYILPGDWSSIWNGADHDCSGANGQCFPNPPFVSGKLEVEADTANGLGYVFRVSNSNITSRDADPTKPLIDERYFPAAYPTILKGCHTTNCTAQTGAPFPIQIQDLGKIPSNWHVTVGGDAGVRTAGSYGGVYDVSYDIWLDIGRRPGDCVPYTSGQPAPQHKQCFYHPWNASEKADVMPLAGQYVMQPYGTEVMIWLGYYDGSGRAAGTDGAQVSPAGSKIATANIGGYDWDVWVGSGRDTTDANLYWNVVSFIRPQNTAVWDNYATSLSFTDTAGNAMDTADFIKYVYQNMGGTPAGQSLGCPIAYSADNASNPPTANVNPCAGPDWWLTDIDAGFEIWDRGQGLQTDTFSVHPTFADVVSSERVLQGDPNTKVFNWQKYFQLFESTSCTGTVTYDIQSQETFDWAKTNTSPADWAWCANTRWYSDTKFGGSGDPLYPCAEPSTQGTKLAMTKLYADPNTAGNTDWYAIVNPVYSHGMHGPMTIYFYCDGSPLESKNIYIDPSGRVMAAAPDGTATSPLSNATVTLLKYDSASGTWPAVPNGLASVMDPMLNTKNSDWTAYDGAFGWNVAVGTYRVQASMAGCHAVGDPSQPIAETGDLVVQNNPIVNLELLLDCSGATGQAPSRPTGNLSTTLTITNNWTSGGPNGTGGYCANVNGTNNTGAALDWTTTFTLTDSGTIYTTWNAIFAQSGNTITVSGDPAGNILQPGQSLNSVGFCVNRGPGGTPPATYTLSVTKAGAGSGTVTSSPAGISCGSTCSANYAGGTNVTLTATPASGSVFAGWSGACSGAGTCTVAMSAAKSVTATFKTQPVTTKLVITNNWTTGGPHGKGGYCANLVVTNNSSAALDWKVSFPLPEASTIYSFWNAIWSLSGSQVTAEGVSWNNILQPGQSTTSVGFCANR